MNLIRIAEQNDWVVFIITGCLFLYVFMLLSLQRDSSVREFLVQKFQDSSNSFLSWMIISFVFCLLFSTFLAHYIPVVPERVSRFTFFGYELNRFGYTITVVASFYLIKNLLSYLFFAGTGALKKWDLFCFTVSKFYFCISLVVIVLCVMSYYYPDDELQRLTYYFWGFLLMFVFKLFYYLFHRNDILPQKWYYKFLYICTLQIVPVLVLWKVLFF